jgi:hypothetical protein
LLHFLAVLEHHAGWEEAAASSLFTLVDKGAGAVVTAARAVRAGLRRVQHLLIELRLGRPVKGSIRPADHGHVDDIR